MRAHPPLLIGRAPCVRRYHSLRAGGAVLISMIGPRGVGTSRLAAAVAGAVAHVWWVELDGGGLSAALARAVGARAGGLGRAMAALPPGLVVLDGLHTPGAADPETIQRLIEAGPQLDWLVTGARPLGLPDERVIPVAPLTEPEALRLFAVIAGELEPETPALVRRLGGRPASIIWAARRAAILGAAAQIERLDARSEAGVSLQGAHLAAEWPGLPSDLRDLWLACALIGDGPLSLVEAAGGAIEGVLALAARGLIETRKDPTSTRVIVPPSLADAAAVVAGSEAVDAAAARAAARLRPRLETSRRAYAGVDGAAAAALLAEWTPAIRRIARRVDPALAARLLNSLQPLRLVADSAGLPDPVLEAAADAAEASGLSALIVDARVGQARHAFMHGAFSRAQSLLDSPALNDAEHWGLALGRAHCVLRTGATDRAAAALDRADALAPDADARLQVEIQRALGVALSDDRAGAIEALTDIAHRADAVGATRTAAVARWHLGCAAVEHSDPLAGVAALRRAVEVLGGLGERGCERVTRGWIARGLRRAGVVDAAEAEARAGHQAARRANLPEAELDCAAELLWLALERDAPAEVMRWRLAVMAVLPETRRPRAAERARQALAMAAETRLWVAADGTWLRAPDGEIIDLRRRRALRRVLACLAAARGRTPGRPLDVPTLFAAGWPDTEIRAESRARRVYTAIWQLRDLGLGDGLMHDDGGYRLAEAVHVAPEPPPASADRRPRAVGAARG